MLQRIHHNLREHKTKLLDLPRSSVTIVYNHLFYLGFTENYPESVMDLLREEQGV